jgi:hypothetical protein
MAVSDLKRNLDSQLIRGFEAVARRAGNVLVFNGKKASVVATPISYEHIQEIVGFLPKRWADVELTRKSFTKLGCTNEDYASLDGVVLRIRKRSGDDVGDPFVHLVLHSTPDQASTSAAAAAQEESGSVELAIGQVEVFVNFGRRKSSRNNVFTELYIEKIGDPNPIAISVTPFERTIDSFKIALGAMPDTTGYVLYWKVQL